MGKKKGVKMPLGEFLGDAAKASWADEAVELPDMPVSSSGVDGAGAGAVEYSRSDYGHRQDRDRGYSQERRPRMEREKKPLPTHPPYCAFVGNLSIDATEQDVSEFFVNSKSVRIIRDFDKRSKGFGYVEFETLDELKAALEKDGVEMMGRMLRLDVAEGQRDQNRPIERRQDREYQPRRQEEPEEVLPSNWRRAEPVAPSAPSRSTFTPRDRERDNSTTTSFGGRKDFGSRDRGDRNAPFERKQYSDRPSFGGQGAAAAAASGEGRPERRGPSSYNDGPRPRRSDERDVDFSALGARRMQAADAKPAVDAKPAAPAPAPAASKSNPFGSARAVDTNSKLRAKSTETKPREKKEASATATGGAAANPWGNFRRNQ